VFYITGICDITPSLLYNMLHNMTQPSRCAHSRLIDRSGAPPGSVDDPGRFVDDVSQDKDGRPDPPIRRVDSSASRFTGVPARPGSRAGPLPGGTDHTFFCIMHTSFVVAVCMMSTLEAFYCPRFMSLGSSSRKISPAMNALVGEFGVRLERTQTHLQAQI
jgi:hypothetical protein